MSGILGISARRGSSNFSRVWPFLEQRTGNVLVHRRGQARREISRRESRAHGRVSVETVLVAERRLGERIRAVCARSVKKFAFGVGRYNSRERSLFCITSSAGAEIYDRSHLSCRELLRESPDSPLPVHRNRLARSPRLPAGNANYHHCAKLEIFYLSVHLSIGRAALGLHDRIVDANKIFTARPCRKLRVRGAIFRL